LLSPDHLAQLDRDAYAALARRGCSYVIERILGISGMVVVATLSLLGLWLWGASPLTMAMMLLCSAWLGIVGDWAKALTLRDAVGHELAAADADHWVWSVARALMTGRTTIRSSDPPKRETMHHLLVADLICASAAIVMTLLMLRDRGHDIVARQAIDPWILVPPAVVAA
jgi:hypothetical protein